MAIVLLSGGLDSALNLAIAAQEKKVRLALTIHYGQRAYSQEKKAAQVLAAFYGVEWRELSLPFLGELSSSSLTRKNQALPEFSLEQLDSSEYTVSSMQSVWVPNRNGIFLNIAALFAEALGEKKILVGFNQEEASTFPDNTKEFLDASTKALHYSTMNHVEVSSYTLAWDKTRIMKEALEIGLPLDLVWSCYEEGPKRCWKCESCKRMERALIANQAQDCLERLK